jgi:beta-galactosidase
VKRYEAGIEPLLADVPEQVEVTRRTKGGKEFYFLLNHGDSPATVKSAEGFRDLLSGEPVAAAITVGPFGYRVISKAERTQ